MSQQLPINVRFCNMEADPALSQQVIDRFERLAAKGDPLMNCSMSIQVDRRRPHAPGYVAHARVVTPTGEIVASRDDRFQLQHESAAQIVRDTMDALERRLDVRRATSDPRVQ